MIGRKGMRRWLARGFGLRARMTASYVVVTFAAVIVVEALAGLLVLPNVNQQIDLSIRVANTAGDYVKQFEPVVTKGSARQLTSGVTLQDLLGRPQLGAAGANMRPGEERSLDKGVLIPFEDRPLPDPAPMSLALVLDPQGVIYASSYPGRYPVGTSAVDRLPTTWQDRGSAVGKLADGAVAWASATIMDVSPDPGSRDFVPGTPVQKDVLGYVYVQVPLPATAAPDPATIEPLLRSGLIFLLVTIPVGVLFGMLTTSGTVRRLRRLAAGTVGFAAGDFSQRVPESGSDEVGQLERHFNSMAGRLSDSIAEQRALAERNARLAERSRISRELHDSISQDLFSMSALVGGLRKALPADSAVQPQLETLGRTVGSTIQEMRALLLELRPTALEEKGLLPALTDLCEAYEVRVGVQVRRELEPVSLGPAGEQAMFRIAQEGLANAVRHSEADRIELHLRSSGEEAELTVADNGRGFDRTASTHGLGLRLMAERVRELGGSLAIDTGAGRGTRLRVLLPAGT
jgi:signal transduction histidine kinase